MFTFFALDTSSDIALHRVLAIMSEHFLVPDKALHWTDFDAETTTLTLIRKLSPDIGFIFVCLWGDFGHCNFFHLDFVCN